MGFLGKLLGGFMGGGGDEGGAMPKLQQPDYANYWKQYTGWLANINKRTEGQLADVRARMSAAGASPDMLMQQTEHLESQRKSDIATLEGGPTYGYLKEGFDIASGKASNPYDKDMPGAVTPPNTTGRGYSPGEWEEISGGPDRSAVPPTLSEYYGKFFGTAAGATPQTEAEQATARAKMAAGGAVIKGGGGGSVGSASGAASSPALGGSTKDTFWS